MTKLAHNLGAMRMERNPVKNWMRRTGYRVASRLPVVGRDLREFRKKPEARVQTGFIQGQCEKTVP